MTCHRLCDLVNDAVCMNLCALALDPKHYYLILQGQYWYLYHKDLLKPVAQIGHNEPLKLELIKAFLKEHT